MTSNAPMIDVSARGVFVEQLIIGSDNGVPAVLASSMSGPDVQTGWLHVLAPHLRPPVDPDAPRPPALSYLRFSDGSAAVLSRTGADRAVEGVAHVLLGRADLLTPGLALSLSAWSGWHFGQPGQALLQLRPDQLRLGFDVAGALRAQALADADQLARVLGWLLQTSDRPLSIIGCPEPDRVALLWGLTEIAAPICRTRAWTFSTDEGGPSDSWPEIVCLASRPDGPGGGRRTTVDLTRDQWASPEHVKQANRLVFTYQHGWDPAQPPPASAPVVGPPSGPAETPSYAAVGGPAWQPLSPVGHPPGPVVDATPGELAQLLLGAQDGRDLDVRMTRLEQYTAHPDTRLALRGALAGGDHGLARIVELVPPIVHNAVYERLALLLFGPELVDLETRAGQDQAGELVENAECEEFVHALVRLAQAHDRLDRVAPAMGVRWLRQVTSAGPARVEARGPVFAALATVGRLVGTASLAWQQRLFLAGCVVLVVLGFGLGLLVGWLASDPAPPVTVEAPLPSSAPGPVSSVPVSPPAPAGVTVANPTVAGSLDEGDLVVGGTVANLPTDEQLWLFVSRVEGAGTVYYLQPGPCPVAVEGAWECRQGAAIPEPAAVPEGSGAGMAIVVIRADPDAASSLVELNRGRAPDATAVSIPALPAGAEAVLRQPL